MGGRVAVETIRPSRQRFVSLSQTASYNWKILDEPGNNMEQLFVPVLLRVLIAEELIDKQLNEHARIPPPHNFF